jgi:hypothetical protein
VGEVDSQAEPCRQNRWQGYVPVNENVVLKEVGKTYHMCPTFAGDRDWPSGAYNPKTNVMFMPLQDAAIDAPICLQGITCSAHTAMRFPTIVHSGVTTFEPSPDFHHMQTRRVLCRSRYPSRSSTAYGVR